jgi:beta-phosphoglucomutase-like phosphatase (HAD superfamily)
MPKLEAVVYFDRLATPVPGDPCAWLADSSPQVKAGFAAGVSVVYLNQPHDEPTLLVPSRDATSRVRVPGRSAWRVAGQPRPPRPRSISRFAIESTMREGQ